jgi:O-glycosyl hydrolase
MILFSSFHRLSARLLLPALALLQSGLHAIAGVTVTQNIGPGATSWPGTPILQTVTNPASQLVVGESFGGGVTTYSQTFTLSGPNNYTLEAIFLYAGGGSGTTATATVRLALYDLGGRTAPNPASYSPGINLLGGGAGLPITYTTQANGLLRFDFTDADQVQLVAGRMYAFEIQGVSNTTPMMWVRNTSDTYTGGAAYRNRAWINGSNARDFGFALYGPINTDPVPPAECTINASITHQLIDGFGAGVVFLDFGLDPMTGAQMDALYGTGPNQMGLTLMRVRISPDGYLGTALTNGRMAHERGARILATPWTPPAAMKDNNSTIVGSLMPSQYGNYVAYLNDFTDRMAANGAPVSVVSLQNEPDYAPTYESCLWTAAQFQTFCRDFAGGIKVPVMMPEAFAFNQAVSNPTLNDPLAAANVDYIGGHLYGATIRDYPLAHSLGKRSWMTEFLINDQAIATAIETAQQINDCLTVGNMSAYIWWKTIGNANGLLNASGVLQRRAYVMAQFSRFVRPGDYRINVSANTGPLGISAFKDPVTGRFAIVVVNGSGAAQPQRFTVDGLATASVTPWITSATQSLEQQAPLTISEGEFTATIPALSVVTFVGTDAPVITSGSAASATFGEAFAFQVTATHSPTSYAASGLPPGLTIDPVSGVISGAPTAAGDYEAVVIAANAGGSGLQALAISVVKANATVTLGDLTAYYDGTPRAASATTSPSGLSVNFTYNGEPAAPVYPGTYTVVATIEDPNHVGTATGTLVIETTARVRHMTSLNGGVDGSVQILTSENTTLNSSAWIAGGLLVPGTPAVRLNGHPTFGGVVDGPGSPDPTSAIVTLNDGAVLGHLARPVDPLALPVVAAPPQPQGTRNVSLNHAGQSAGDFTTLRNLTLNSNVGLIAVPPGTYGSFATNSGSGFVLGVAGAIEPAIYNLQNLTLNGGSRIEIAGPVIFTLAGGLSVNSGVTFSEHAVEWFTLQLASGGLSLSGAVVLPAKVIAPSGTVTLNGKSTLYGTVKADRLIVNRDALLEKP